MPDVGAMARLVAALVVVAAALQGCSSERAQGAGEPATVPASALVRSLASVADVNRVMDSTAMTPHPVTDTMADDRALLPNLNCLGVWQPDQAAIYGAPGEPDGWNALARQTLRTPDTDQWSSLVRQSVVSYPSAEAAQRFFDQSAQRWSQCTNHRVNITLNDRPMPKWLSGDLGRAEGQLAMPVAMGMGAENRVCQRVLSIYSNVIIDVEACRPPLPIVTSASEIAAKIQRSLPA
ncbi:sensor domain-containing protein [Mycolicibacterium sp. GCM10028919]|uniref:sensor domain-containing protein n=1 Tax=Mycolicibacterium sp. GCM10028919 TaxID=3273401 RepID=UPI00360991D1